MFLDGPGGFWRVQLFRCTEVAGTNTTASDLVIDELVPEGTGRDIYRTVNRLRKERIGFIHNCSPLAKDILDIILGFPLGHQFGIKHIAAALPQHSRQKIRTTLYSMGDRGLIIERSGYGAYRVVFSIPEQGATTIHDRVSQKRNGAS